MEVIGFTALVMVLAYVILYLNVQRRSMGKPVNLQGKEKPFVMHPGKVVKLCAIVGSSEKPPVKLAEEIIHQLYRINRGRWAVADAELRTNLSSWEYSSACDKVLHKLVRNTPRLADSEDDPTLTLGVLSMLPSGYVRNPAVVELSKLYDGKELPFLLLRMNDWVLSISTTARTAVQARVREEYIPHFLENIQLVRQLARASRVDNTDLVQQVYELINTKATSDQLAHLLDDPSAKNRHFAARLIMKRSSATSTETYKIISSHVDPLMRRFAVEWVRQHSPHDVAIVELQRFISDKSAMVRTTAVKELAMLDMSLAKQHLQSMLLDTNRTVRFTTRYFLSKDEQQDFRKYYLDHLSSSESKVKVASLLGLAETGIPGDSEYAIRYLNDESPRLRATAVQALARLTGSQNITAYLKAANDPAGSVRKAARLALSANANQVQVPQLLEHFKQGSYEARNIFIGLAGKLGKWDKLSALLQMVSAATPNELARLDDEIHDWINNFNKAYVPIQESSALELDKLLAAANTKLTEDRARVLKFYLQ